MTRSAFPFLILLIALALGLSAAMALAWVIARRLRRSGWTDAIWAFATGAAGVAAALVPVGDDAITIRQWVVAVLVALWSLRLGSHLGGRLIKERSDPRQAELRRGWNVAFARRMFWFLQVQAAAAFVLTISILVAARNPAPGWAWSDAAGALIVLLAIAGEAAADRQLARFRARPVNRNRVCQTGLWSLSRHPNYFFEWLGWTGYAIIAVGPAGSYGWGWLALSGPAFMYCLLVHVSGVPPLDAHMLRSREAGFREYQARVGAFWPKLPRPRLQDLRQRTRSKG